MRMIHVCAPPQTLVILGHVRSSLTGPWFYDGFQVLEMLPLDDPVPGSYRSSSSSSETTTSAVAAVYSSQAGPRTEPSVSPSVVRT